MRESSLGDVGGGVRGSKKQAERGEYVQKMTVSAAVKLIPSPPALVERQKTKISGLGISFISISLTSLAGRKEMEEGKILQTATQPASVFGDSLCLPGSNHIPPLIDWTTTIQPQILVLPINKVFFRQIHHPSHLEVQKYTMSTIFQFPQQIIQTSKFCRIDN